MTVSGKERKPRTDKERDHLNRKATSTRPGLRPAQTTKQLPSAPLRATSEPLIILP